MFLEERDDIIQVLKLNQDLIDKNGVLLLKKGNQIELSDEKYMKYKHLGIFDEVKEASENYSKRDNSANITKVNFNPKEEHSIRTNHSIIQLSKKLKLDEKAFSRATEIVIDIIYNSKESKWYKHFITLTNYVDWLFAHSINTAMISTIIGFRMAYDNEKLKQLALGALLHDIGLILLPKNILMKPCKLSDMEIEIIKRHCELGYSMLEESELPEISKNVILQHHEKLDGSGYPDGLLEKDIYTESKIVMIAESFDTVTTTRPYKAAQTSNSVISEMISAPHIYDNNLVGILAKSMLE